MRVGLATSIDTVAKQPPREFVSSATSAAAGSTSRVAFQLY